MKLKFLIFNCSLLIFMSCVAHRPVTSSHVERIETQLKPVAVGADTIEIALYQSRDAARCVQSVARPNESKPNESKPNESNERAVARQDAARCVPTMRSVASTRALRVESQHTDSTMRIKLTLAPDTIFVPYTHHIRSDTIVVPDPVTKAKLTTARWQIAMLILIIIVATIIVGTQRAAS